MTVSYYLADPDPDTLTHAEHATLTADVGDDDTLPEASPVPPPAPLAVVPELVWQDYANCLGCDPELFFPERGATTREAKAVCAGCAVREDCLEYAVAKGEKFGIWGGKSERERRRIRSERARARRAAS